MMTKTLIKIEWAMNYILIFTQFSPAHQTLPAFSISLEDTSKFNQISHEKVAKDSHDSFTWDAHKIESMHNVVFFLSSLYSDNKLQSWDLGIKDVKNSPKLPFCLFRYFLLVENSQFYIYLAIFKRSFAIGLLKFSSHFNCKNLLLSLNFQILSLEMFFLSRFVDGKEWWC